MSLKPPSHFHTGPGFLRGLGVLGVIFFERGLEVVRECVFFSGVGWFWVVWGWLVRAGFRHSKFSRRLGLSAEKKVCFVKSASEIAFCLTIDER